MFYELIMKQKPREILRNAREAKGLTQTELAEKIGLSLRMYQRIEAGMFPKYKYDTIQQLDTILGTKLYDIIYDKNVPQETLVSEPEPFIEKRRAGKQKENPFLVPLVPIKAQAGYVRAVDQQTYIDTLEKYALPPGVDPHGAIWRYWEIEGESMEPAFHSGDIILTSQVHRMDWENIRNFYLYVIVTQDRVLFKRVYCKNQLEWVLISENEDQFPQQLLPIEYIKEVWVFRRSILSKAPPTKEFKIKV